MVRTPFTSCSRAHGRECLTQAEVQIPQARLP